MAKSARPKPGKKQNSLRNSRTTMSGPAAWTLIPWRDARRENGGHSGSAPNTAPDDFVTAIAGHRNFVRETDQRTCEAPRGEAARPQSGSRNGT